jgi:putative MATE family efflux protein
MEFYSMTSTTAVSGAQSSHGSATTVDPLVSGPVLATLVRLSLPNMAAMLATALVAMAETAYVGFLGTPALAGLALVFPMVMLQQMMSGGAMGGGISSAVARALGAGNDKQASALAAHAVIIGASAGLGFTVLFLLAGERIYALLGGRGPALEQAMLYSNVIFLGAPAIWLTHTLASIVRGGGNMKVPSMALLVVTLVQVLLSGGLGLGWASMPRWGMAGIALGQVLAYAGGAIFLLWYLTSERARVRLSATGFAMQWRLFRDILKVGALACVAPVQSVLTVLIITRLVATFGIEALAGYGIGSRLEFLLIPIAFAVGVACIPMVGMAIGAGKIERARRVAWTGSIAASGIVGGVGVLVALFPDLWSGLFTQDKAVLAYAAGYFAWAGPAYVFTGLGLCLYFASQGSGKVLGPVLAGTLRLVIVAAGGWSLQTTSASVWSVYPLIALGMVMFGLATALAVYLVPWGPVRQGGR